MNFIEKSIAAVFPAWGAHRAENRYLIAQYEGALATQGVPAKKAKDNISKDVERSQLELAQVARHYEQNDPLFAAAIDEVVKNTIGDGLTIHPQPKNKDGKINKEFAKVLRRLNKAHDRVLEMDGRTSRGEAEQLLIRSAFRDGEAFARMVYMGGHDYLGDIPFGVQLFELDNVDAKLNDEKNGIVNGIQYGQWNRVIAYMFKADPNSSAKPVALAAEDVLQIAFKKRIRQGRGISMAAPVIKSLKDLDAFFEAYKIQTITAARLSLVHKKAKSDRDDRYAPKSATGNTKMELKYNNKITIGEKDELKVLESQKQVDAAAGFNQQLSRKVTSGLGVSHSSVTSEYIKAFTAQRQENLDRWAGYRVLRRKVAEPFTRPIYEKRLGIALLTGKIDIPPELDMNTLYDCEITGAVMPWIDPQKEANSIKTLNKLGMKSISRALSENNIDPESELQAYKEELELMRELGLKFDDKGEMTLIDELQEEYDEENDPRDADSRENGASPEE
ncbi:phage portal protein [Vibrio sp. OCN044]|uniref:Phage portal protein n=1 Tax=Vibrio tetraodonis subsp. pristinus TaxID=2695891 RepID=A0A6L8M286_9VIBR|nr:phage portal protein [Vibrio tetraodonis]MYM61646.1 phage portal protein [Vibrio tetraodonis subsp. pristinus]